MVFPFRYIVEYARSKPEEYYRAEKEVFKEEPAPEDINIRGLFLEWLIYEYRQTTGATFFVEYLLRDPHKLTKKILDSFRQILRTHFYSEFQIIKTKKGEYIEIEDLFSGDTYRVFDKMGSSHIDKTGSLRAHLGCVDGVWYFVGSNPIYLPMTYTPRMKKITQKEMKKPESMMKETMELLLHRLNNPLVSPPRITKQEIELKRNNLKKAFQKATVRHGTKMTFEHLLDEVYNENESQPLDFFHKLTKKGLSVEFMLGDFQLLQDIWNYFPHKILGKKSPVEMYNNFKGKIKPD